MRKEIEEVRKKTADIPRNKRTRVYVEIWHEPSMTAGKGSFIDEMIDIAGGANIAHDVIRPYCNFSHEKVVNLNPQVIILAYMDKAPLKLVESRMGWKNIDAVKNKRVFGDINPDLLLRPGPRITEAIRLIHNKLYEQN
jgi:iron complex transport system substrate-binding protein